MSNRTFTPEEAAQIANAYFTKRVTELSKSLEDLKTQELAKAVVPTHAAHGGTGVSAGTEDIAAGKLKKEELCKKCNESCGGKCGMEKSILKDGKGKVKDTGINPESVLPEDAKSKEINDEDGPGGAIKKGKKLGKAMPQPLSKPPVSQTQRAAMGAAASGNSTLGIPKKVGKEFIDADKGGKLPAKKDEMEKAVTPPTAKPPSGKVPGGAAAPVSKPGTVKGEMSSEESSESSREESSEGSHEESSPMQKDVAPASTPAPAPAPAASKPMTAQANQQQGVLSLLRSDKPMAKAVPNPALAPTAISKPKVAAAGGPKMDPTKAQQSVMGLHSNTPSKAVPMDRSTVMAAAQQGHFNPKPGTVGSVPHNKPDSSGLELARQPTAGKGTMATDLHTPSTKKPGIFGRLFGKGEMNQANNNGTAETGIVEKNDDVKSKIRELASKAPPKGEAPTTAKMKEVQSKIKELASQAPKAPETK